MRKPHFPDQAARRAASWLARVTAAVSLSLALAVLGLTTGTAHAAGSPPVSTISPTTAATAASGSPSIPEGAAQCPSVGKKSSPAAACKGHHHKLAANSKVTATFPKGAAACPSVPGKHPSSTTAACGTVHGTSGLRPSVVVGGGGGYSVSLSASSSWVAAGTSVTLTATASTDVGPTPYFIEILRQGGSSVAICGSGTTCSTTVNSSGGSTQNFIAYISSYGTSDPPPSVQATSSTVGVNWLTITLYVTTISQHTGLSVGVEADTNVDVGPSPYWITIFDATTGANIISCGSHWYCASQVNPGAQTARRYVGYVSGFGAGSSQTNPPPGILLTSNDITVTWANYVPAGPPNGWFAWDFTPGIGSFTESDPVNLVVYKPDGGAREAFESAITRAGWYNNTCYNTNVKFYTGSDYNQVGNSSSSSQPIGSYATNVATTWDSSTPPPGYHGCGPAAPAERDHLRYWASADDSTVWIAASYEVECSTAGVFETHCVSANGFDRGRDDLSGRLLSALRSAFPYTTSNYVQAYQSGNYVSSGIWYDGQVDVLVPRADVYQVSGNHAAWVSDSYNGAPLTSITLPSGGVSNNIYITFNNQGPGTWDPNTVLAYWSGGTNDGQPSDGTAWCHAPGGVDWSTCNPGIPAWIGSGTVAPGSNRTFEFQVQANVAPGTYTLYFRPAQRQPDGTYAWMNTANGNRTYDYFTVHVT